MNLFSECMDRLKPALRVSKDQEVAAALGLSKTAFSERKKRGSFPDRELRKLAMERPDLGIDVDYVLTGQQAVAAKPAWLRLKAQLEQDDDGAVAAWLGMDLAAVNAYTRRGVFPVQQFLAACEARPEVVDADYVLTGVGMAAQSMIGSAKRSQAAGIDLAAEECMVALYRKDLLFRQAADALVALANGMAASLLTPSGQNKTKEPTARTVHETRKKTL